MAQPYVGEVRLFAGNFPPAGWMFCDGQLLDISSNETLFQLIGTTYGGDGQQQFALPDLRGRLPVHQGSSLVMGESLGQEAVALNLSQIPAHQHQLMAAVPAVSTSTAINASSPSPAGNLPAVGSTKVYAAATVKPTAALNAAVVNSSGGSQPHNNLMPYLCVSYIISMYGIYPS